MEDGKTYVNIGNLKRERLTQWGILRFVTSPVLPCNEKVRNTVLYGARGLRQIQFQLLCLRRDEIGKVTVALFKLFESTRLHYASLS